MNSQITTLAFCLLFLLICTTSINAWTVTSFPPENFWVADYTVVPSYWNPGMVVGYKVDTVWDGNNPNTILSHQYQMTDTAFYMRSAIWNNTHKIDLNKNFVLDFKLYFGRGKYIYPNYNLEPGDRDYRISDGMCFVLHTKDSAMTKNLWGDDMGYAVNVFDKPDVYPLTVSTFAVEWDTQFSYVVDGDIDDIEGFPMIQDTTVDYWWPITNNHISYLKNANMATIKRQDGSPAVGQMQNNWEGVAYNDWFNVRIEWIKSYDSNGTPYYDLLTYMEEKDSLDPQRGQLLLRNSMRFNNINEVIDGLEPDSNCQALVTWGITCGTSTPSNKHKVEFVRLTNYDTDSLAEEEIPFVIYTTHKQQDSQTNTQIYDTLYTSISGCSNSYTLPSATNILTLDNVCFAKKDSARIYVKGLEDTTGIYWDFEKIMKIPARSDSIGIYFDFNDSVLPQNIHGIYSWHEIDLSLVMPKQNHEIKFKINMDKINYALFQIVQMFEIPWDTTTNTLIMEVDNASLFKEFIIPSTYACSYALESTSDDTNFVIPPTMDSNKVVSFELKPNVCSANIPIKLQCKCDRYFNLMIKNTDCIEQTCDAVTIEKAVNSSESAPRISLNGTPQTFHYVVVTNSTTGSNITSVVATEINSTSMIDNIITPINDTNYNVSISFSQGWSSKIVSHEICATLDNGVTCCDTFECVIPGIFFDVARPCDEIDVKIYADMHTADYWLNPGLVNSPSVPLLYIAIYDEWGYLHQVLHNSIPVSAEGTIYYGDLPARLYNLVFWWGEYLKVIPILDTGVGAGEATDANPNE